MKIEQNNDDRDYDDSSFEDYDENQSNRGSHLNASNRDNRSQAVRRNRTSNSGGDSQSQRSETMKSQSQRGYTNAFKDDDDEPTYSSKTSLAQSSIYELIHDTINRDAFHIKPPKQFKALMLYIFLIPLTHMQYYTIPNPIKKGKSNFYPLTLFLCLVWIWFYTWLIVWWTFSLTEASNLRYNMLPMLLYPFGISIRDNKKFLDFRLALKVFKDELQDQEISLAETYSGPIF